MPKAPGSELRDTILNLLKLQFSYVESEYKVLNKSADIFYVDDTNSLFQNSVAIECKDWASPLDSSKIREIYFEYFPGISAGEIDRLIIVGRHELGRDPTETVRSLNKVTYISFDKFITSMMNFSYLLQDNSLAFKNHDASANFLTSAVLNESVSVEQRVREWLTNEEGVLLIYGGYGIGKSSFSYFITSELSKEYRSATFGRIPIRISLGDLFHKQDLKSLIASTLSGADGAAGVKNFSYNLFLEMVRLGYFVLILDGFDEMRHAMDVEDFEYTFDEMSALFMGKSKTIILGRPDSFFTDDEEDRVVDAVIGKKTKHSKIEMSMLSSRQVSDYIDNYIEKYNGNNATVSELIDLKMRALDGELDVISRPVQLKMFTSIMDRMVGRENVFNRYELYYNFIYNFSRREDQKNSRKFAKTGDWKYGYSDPRTIFMQNLAWWILTVKKENRFFPREVPWDFIPTELRDRTDRDTALREIILGSVVEPEKRNRKAVAIQVKGFRHYYFPHKSYIEFLVAEYFCRADFSREMYAQFFEIANGEILSFVEEGPADATRNFRRGVEFARGTISSQILKIAARDPAISGEKSQLMEGKGGSGRLYVFYYWLLASGAAADEIETFLFSALLRASSLPRCGAAYAMIADYIGREQAPSLCRRMLVYCFEQIGIFNFQKILEYHEGAVVYSADATAVHMAFFADAVELGRGRIRLNVRRAREFAKSMCKSHLYVGGFDILPAAECKTYDFDQELFSPMRSDIRNLLMKHLSGDVRVAKVSMKGH